MWDSIDRATTGRLDVGHCAEERNRRHCCVGAEKPCRFLSNVLEGAIDRDMLCIWGRGRVGCVGEVGVVELNGSSSGVTLGWNRHNFSDHRSRAWMMTSTPRILELQRKKYKLPAGSTGHSLLPGVLACRIPCSVWRSRSANQLHFMFCLQFGAFMSLFRVGENVRAYVSFYFLYFLAMASE